MIEESNPTEPSPLVMMRCWGDFALRGENGVDLRPRGRKPRAIFAYLALHPGMAIGRERLLGLLWGERAEEQARASLRQAIQELKPLANGFGLVQVDRESLALAPGRLVTDLDQLRSALQRRDWDAFIARLPEPDERLFADLEGLDVGFDDWLSIEQRRQEQELLSLVAEAREAAFVSGDRRSARLLETRLRERDPEIVLPLAEEKTPPPLVSLSPPKPGSDAPTLRRNWQAASLVAGLLLVGAVSSGAFAPAGKLTAAGDGPLATSSEVQSLYLNARQRIRDRNPQAIEDSRALLERALALDPNFAPAWSRLALVARLEGNRPGASGERARAEALTHARRALALSPELAEAHGVLGVILGFETPAGRRSIEHAASLDPNSAEIQYWVGNAYLSQPDYGRAFAAFRKASDLDPAWTHPARQAAQIAVSIGRPEVAEIYLQRVEREGTVYDARLLRGIIAASAGDLSAATVALGEARASTDDLGKQSIATYNRAIILFAMGLTDEAQREWASCRLAWAEGRDSTLTMPERYAGHLALRRGELPSAARIAQLNRIRGEPRAHVLLRDIVDQMIQSGRAGEAVALYDGRDGLLGISAAARASSIQLEFAPTVASALLAVGRAEEARRLLLLANARIGSTLERSGGIVDANFLGAAAATWAMLGRKDQAVQALERAVSRGWVNADLQSEDLPEDIGAEIVFRSLRGDPRFESVRQGLNRRLAVERAELLRLTSRA